MKLIFALVSRRVAEMRVMEGAVSLEVESVTIHSHSVKAESDALLAFAEITVIL